MNDDELIKRIEYYIKNPKNPNYNICISGRFVPEGEFENPKNNIFNPYSCSEDIDLDVKYLFCDKNSVHFETIGVKTFGIHMSLQAFINSQKIKTIKGMINEKRKQKLEQLLKTKNDIK